MIDLAQEHGVGIYPETKHPTYFDSIGLSLEEPLVETLEANGYRKSRDPVFIQSFEVGNLQQLNEIIDVKLVQLINSGGAPYDFVESGDPRTYADLITRSGLSEISEYADGIGPNKDLIVPRDSGGNLQRPTMLVRNAHRTDLVVHAWTFRNENTFLPTNLRAGDPSSPFFPQATGDAPAEYAIFFSTGLDGVFSDYPDTAVASRKESFNR